MALNLIESIGHSKTQISVSGLLSKVIDEPCLIIDMDRPDRAIDCVVCRNSDPAINTDDLIEIFHGQAHSTACIVFSRGGE